MEVRGWPPPVNLAVTEVPPTPSVARQGLATGAVLAGTERALPPGEADEAAAAQPSGGERALPDSFPLVVSGSEGQVRGGGGVGAGPGLTQRRG